MLFLLALVLGASAYEGNMTDCNSETVFNGKPMTDGEFVYECVMDDYNKPYLLQIACFENGTSLAPYSKITKMHGRVRTYCASGEIILQKVTEHVAGCAFNESVYPVDSQWDEENSKKSNVRKVRMECSNSTGYFEKRILGCYSDDDTVVDVGEMHQKADGTFEKCVELTPDTVEMISVDASDASCIIGNITYAHGEEWIDEKIAARIRCSMGTISKKACVLGNADIPLYDKRTTSNGCVFLCHSIYNVYSCDEQLENFEVIAPSTATPISF